MSQLPKDAVEKGDRWAAFRGLSWWQLVLSLLPLVLVGLGGLIGGVFGGAGMWANLKVARLPLHSAVKALLMITVVVAAYLIWSVVAVAARSAMGL